MSVKEIDMNLLVVEAIEGFAYRHNMTTLETYQLFYNNNIINLIREHYNVLHTQDLEESIFFVEDVLRRMGYGQ